VNAARKKKCSRAAKTAQAIWESVVVERKRDIKRENRRREMSALLVKTN